MASNLNSGKSIARRAVNQIWISRTSRDPIRRGVHVSSYEKNPDEPVRSSPVPDEVIQLDSDKYWGPNPITGVFGPADKNGGDNHFNLRGAQSAADSGAKSTLDQTAWFRPLEDVDKPPSV